jgi:hypothetical protein
VVRSVDPRSLLAVIRGSISRPASFFLNYSRVPAPSVRLSRRASV